MTMIPSPASAACPGVFAGKQCDGDAFAVENDVCSVTGAVSTVTCDLAAAGDTVHGDGTLYDYCDEWTTGCEYTLSECLVTEF